MHNHLKSRLIFGGLYIVLILQSCYDPTSGCLDSLASNYNVAAEDECEDCCTYPNVIMSMNHLWNGESFIFGDTLVNEIGSKCILIDSKFHLSNFTFSLQNGNIVTNRDSVQLSINSQDTTIADDIALIRKNQSTSTLHSFRSADTVVNYSFRLGVPNELDSLTEINAEKYNNLAYNNGMRTGNAYAPYWFQIAVGDSLTDTISVFGDQDFLFSNEVMVTIEEGSNVSVPLTIQYDLWMEEINFIDDDADEIANKLRANATKAFEQ